MWSCACCGTCWVETTGANWCFINSTGLTYQSLFTGFGSITTCVKQKLHKGVCGPRRSFVKTHKPFQVMPLDLFGLGAHNKNSEGVIHESCQCWKCWCIWKYCKVEHSESQLFTHFFNHHLQQKLEILSWLFLFFPWACMSAPQIHLCFLCKTSHLAAAVKKEKKGSLVTFKAYNGLCSLDEWCTCWLLFHV